MRPEAQPGFAKREGLKPKAFFLFAQQLSNSDPVLNKPYLKCMYLCINCIAEGRIYTMYRREVEGHSPQPLGNFCDFAAKIAILTPFQSHFARF